MVLFDKIKKFDIGGKNELFIGTKGKEKYFIKRYVVRKGREKDDLLKVKCEILCYKNIRSIELPKMVESSRKDRTLVLKFVELKEIKASRNNVGRILKFYLNKLSKVKSNFLPRVTYDYYKNSLYVRALKLKKANVINNLGSIYQRFKSNKLLINKSSNHFSHGDLYLGNFKFLKGKLTVIDLEHSRRDNLMYDLATLYVDLYRDRKLSEYFIKKIKEFDFYNGKLFSLMIYRRCIEVLYPLMGNRNSIVYKTAKELVDSDLNF